MDKVKQNLPPTLQNASEQIIVTLVVCAYLNVKFSAQKTRWELVVKKAMTWLKKEWQKQQPGGGGEIDWQDVGKQVGVACGF